MQFRPYQATDLERCLELCRLNEKDRFPRESINDYKKALEDGSTYILVGERDGQIVCTGGMHKIQQDDCCCLCYGLVDPAFQNLGIGTALTLARLSLLDVNLDHYLVYIFAVDKSIGFYRRLGFRAFGQWVDKEGKRHPIGRLELDSSEINRAVKLLEQIGITVPAKPVHLPTAFLETNPASTESST